MAVLIWNATDPRSSEKWGEKKEKESDDSLWVSEITAEIVSSKSSLLRH